MEHYSTRRKFKLIPDDDVLPLEINFIPENIRVKFDNEVNLTDEEKTSRLLELIKMLEGHKLSKGIPFKQDFLQRYLIQSRYDVNTAFWRIRNYLTLYKNHSYFFQSIKFPFTEQISCQFITTLPHRCSDGSITLLYELGKWNPEECPFEVAKQLTFMIYMQELRNPVTQFAGFSAIFDFKHISVQHLKYCTPYNIYLLNHTSFEVMPAIYKRFHLINGYTLMNTFLTLVKPFLPSSIRKIIHTHSTPEELLNYFPRSILPEKYGGSLTEYYMADKLKQINAEHDNYPVEGQKNIF